MCWQCNRLKTRSVVCAAPSLRLCVLRPAFATAVLESLLHAAGNSLELSVHLARGAAEDQIGHRIAGNPDVLEGAEDMHLAIRQHDARLGHVLDGEAGLASLASDAADGTGKMLSRQWLHYAFSRRNPEADWGGTGGE